MAFKKGKDDGTKPSLDIFMILGNILVDKSMDVYENHVQNELFQSVFSSFIVCRYLSMNSNPNVRAVALEHLGTIEKMADKPELVYKLLLKVVPKTYNRFTPYIKSGFPRAN
jgi:surface polysaccharide O-acyltransferase-like enzyme